MTRIESGILQSSILRLSPNCDDRPDAEDICGIVLHNISLPPGEFGGRYIDDLFLNQLNPEAHPYFQQIADLHVSSHLLIRRDGEVVQFVPFHKRAWHAGESQWQGRTRCNDFTIGIELEGDDENPFTDRQYQQLTQCVHALALHYPGLSLDRITGHEHIAPGRKTDPGPFFDWTRLQDMLASD